MAVGPRVALNRTSATPKTRAARAWWVVARTCVLVLLGMPSPRASLVVPGLDATQLEPWLKGLVLVEEMNCVACHPGDASLAARSRKAPRLQDAGSRLHPAFIESFIRDPHGTRPGTMMPDVLGTLTPAERDPVARSLTHFLLSLRPSSFSMEAPDAVAATHGRRLFHSRGCAHCHSPRDERGKELEPTASVPLGALEVKYGFKGLVAFLERPHAVRPSGRMPDLQLGRQEIERIAHYLLQDTRVPGGLSYTLFQGKVWEGIDGENVRAERAGHADGFGAGSLAKPSHHSAIQYRGWLRVTKGGRHAFHLTANGALLELDGNQVFQLKPSDRRGPKTMEGFADLAPGWHAIRLDYYHTGHEPRFSLEMDGPDIPRAPIDPSRLSVSTNDIPAHEPFRVDAGLAEVGRRHFEQLGCARCHDDVQVTSSPHVAWAKLDVRRGCLSGGPGPWPRFDLSPQQREWMGLAWARAERPELDDRQQVGKTLAALNCVACHERAGLGGPRPERVALFTGTQPSLGDQGRIPPPLTGVGAKLTPGWLGEVLLRDGRQRDYLDARMPRFGEANVVHLVGLLAKVDVLEPASIPDLAHDQEVKDAGHALVGATGLHCIACHMFNGQKPGEFGALDMARAPERLRKNWFHLYLRQPARFHPTTIMPAYWPDGRPGSVQVLGGDAGKQIEAIWAYLSEGQRAKKPLGLSRESNEVIVADMAEICRGQGPVGYRGIGVGYPERIHLCFDAGEMALRQLWKGEFASVSPGHFRPRGSDLITLPPGVPFHTLATLEDDWPAKRKTNHAFPQDHGYQFRGYHLDARRRPTFRYQFGNVAVEDFFEDVRNAEGKAYFRRSLRLENQGEPVSFHFRAAAGKDVRRRSDHEFTCDTLNVRIISAHSGTVRDGEHGDVLVPLSLPRGQTVLSLEYQW